MNEFKYSNTNKRYYTLDYYFKTEYGSKICKIPINAGFTCPNIDGTKSFDGCSFCNIKGSGDFAGLASEDLLLQWEKGKQMMNKKWNDSLKIAYFQAFSNTYSTVDILREKYQVFIDLDECFGISIGTRPDCLDEEILDYLQEISEQKLLIVELGLQTIHESTSQIINRAHDLETFNAAVKELRKRNINVVVHIINGLAKETKEMMVATAKYIGDMDIQGIKIHLLHVMNDTKLVNQLNNGFLKLLTKEEYIDIVCEQLRYIREGIVIHRLTGDAPSEIFIGPIWSKKKTIVLNDIDKRMKELNIYQGDLIK